MTDQGTDSQILRVVCFWEDAVEAVLKAPFETRPLGTVVRRTDGRWEAVLSFDRNVDRKQRQRHFVALNVGDVRRHPWDLHRLDVHAWDISPSIHFVGQFHGFVSLVGVPESPPWLSEGVLP